MVIGATFTLFSTNISICMVDTWSSVKAIGRYLILFVEGGYVGVHILIVTSRFPMQPSNYRALTLSHIFPISSSFATTWDFSLTDFLLFVLFGREIAASRFPMQPSNYRALTLSHIFPISSAFATTWDFSLTDFLLFVLFGREIAGLSMY